MQTREVKPVVSQTSVIEPVSSQSAATVSNQVTHPRHKKIKDYEKERKELFSKPSPQVFDHKLRQRGKTNNGGDSGPH